MSTRTLQRQLAQEHLSFSDIIDERRHQVVLRLLRQRRRFEELADVLGYTDVSNFSRAFKRWTGLVASRLCATDGLGACCLCQLCFNSRPMRP
jgi:AraC-like DNA-binding protein